ATWLHGDLAASNLLVRGGRLQAVIDFGICGVGDPSCDLKMAWTFFDGASRRAFRERLRLDAATWARGRGWALWKCLKTLADQIRRGEPRVARSRRCVAEIVSDHRATA
ncbi:MAG: phosphotransferase, partial [Longimicrobiales bacterium]